MEERILEAIIGYVVFMFSVVCHEAGHALAAMWGGDKTAYHNGQVTLSPIPHIKQEPFGLGLLPLFSLWRNATEGGMWTFGFASAPFDPLWAMNYPKRAALMAAAGPAANFIIAFVAALLLRLGLFTGFFTVRGGSLFGQGVAEPLAVILDAFMFLNFALGCFNLLPIPPLDGFSILMAFVSRDTAEKVLEFRAQYGLILTVLIFFFSPYLWEVIRPLYSAFLIVMF